jgi:hypothetical protein
MDEKDNIGLIPEQVIIIDGIRLMSGDHALTLNTNFNLKTCLYKLSGRTAESLIRYTVLNNFTTFCQLIGFLTLHYVIKVQPYIPDGFTMLITIKEKL